MRTHLPDVVAVPPDPCGQLAVAPRPRAALPVAQVALRVEDAPVEQGPDLAAPSFHRPEIVSIRFGFGSCHK